MSDPSSRGAGGPAAGSGQLGPPGMPRWVKVLGLVLVVLLVLGGGVMLLAGGDHGPGRHTRQDEAGEQVEQPASDDGRSNEHAPREGGHAPPEDGHIPPEGGHAPPGA